MANQENSRDHAQAALAAFQAGRMMSGLTGGDDREDITDLISDLLHLVDSDPERFDEHEGDMVAERAVSNYLAEVETKVIN